MVKIWGREDGLIDRLSFFNTFDSSLRLVLYLSTIFFTVHRKFPLLKFLNSRFGHYCDFQVKFMVKIWGKKDG
ncbi:MAG: hypothetical protein CO119_07830 [Flavobacteriales bacterium CG_4_9_14_3_um_filter_40_17]|nr:MAG: hypothetical protein CO119_07830 [Flavobacteriales bacterium CG_4_9_14_3_um_filter_40_17]